MWLVLAKPRRSTRGMGQETRTIQPMIEDTMTNTPEDKPIPLIVSLDTPEKRRAHGNLTKRKWRARRKAEMEAVWKDTPDCTPIPYRLT
jgi:hypothetical protein